MRRIGLIGGMSFESTAVYYRLINELVRDRVGGLASADLLLHSVNFAEVVEMQKAGRWDKAAEHLARSAQSLKAAGAQCVLICTNTMHLVATEVQSAVDIPLIHIIDETAKALKAQGLKRPLLLATRYTMEHGFYAERMKMLGVEVMVPDDDDRAGITLQCDHEGLRPVAEMATGGEIPGIGLEDGCGLCPLQFSPKRAQGLHLGGGTGDAKAAHGSSG